LLLEDRFVVLVVEVFVIVVLLLEFCAKTRLPKLSTNIRLSTIPSFFVTDNLLCLLIARPLDQNGKAFTESAR
jgi:hypothetical protein